MYNWCLSVGKGRTFSFLKNKIIQKLFLDKNMLSNEKSLLSDSFNKLNILKKSEKVYHFLFKEEKNLKVEIGKSNYTYKNIHLLEKGYLQIQLKGIFYHLIMN